MTPAYDNFVPLGKWRLGVLTLVLTLSIGAVMTAVLLLGGADPPHAASLVYNANNGDDFIRTWDYSRGMVFTLPNLTLRLPLTVEMEASNSGAASSAWGFALVSEGGKDVVHPVMIDNQGYVITQVGTFDYAHSQFPHLKPGVNRINVNIDPNGLCSVRVNDELLRQQTFSPASQFTVFLYYYGEPKLTWQAIKIYTGG